MTELIPKTAAQDADDTPFVGPKGRIFVLVAAILASAMGFIDGSVTSIATPAMRASLDASLADAQWISNGYLLTMSSLLLLGGAASDRFGLRNVFAAGIGLFVVASVASALAPDAAFLIGARVIQGVGSAFMVPGSLAIIAKAYPKAERGGAIGLWAAASSLTTLLGPVIGGFVITMFGDWSWRLVFAINLPLGGIALALLLLRTPADTPEAGRRLDLFGAAAATIGLFLISLAFIDPDGGRFWPYLLAGLVVMAIFLFWETRAKMPMLPLTLFADRAFSGAQGLTLLVYFGLSAVGFYLPMTMIGGWGATPVEVSLAMTPLGIVLTVLSPFAGQADRQGRAGADPVLRLDRRRGVVSRARADHPAAFGMVRGAADDDLVRLRHELCRRADFDRGDDRRGRPRHRHGVGHQQCGGARRGPVRGGDDGGAGGAGVRGRRGRLAGGEFRPRAADAAVAGRRGAARRRDRPGLCRDLLCRRGARGAVVGDRVDDIAAQAARGACGGVKWGRRRPLHRHSAVPLPRKRGRDPRYQRCSQAPPPCGAGEGDQRSLGGGGAVPQRLSASARRRRPGPRP